MKEPILTKKQVAERLGVSPRTVTNLKLPHLRVGGQNRYFWSQVKAHLRSVQNLPTRQGPERQMTELMEKQLSEWMSQLGQEIESLERAWIELRRFKSHPEYLDRANRLEEALDLIRDVQTEISFEWYGLNRERLEKEKQA